jgi:nucleotide-binding universal stress UspA family protein
MATYRTVLAGTDGSESSLRAVDRAADMARDEDATLVLVCAYFPANKQEVDRASEELGDLTYQVVGSNPAEDVLRKASERAQANGANKITPLAIQDDPVASLTYAVSEQRADLLVVGNRGLNTLTGRILGSVPSSVARQSTCDVLIVHTTSR